MAWKPIVGRKFTLSQFIKYVDELNFRAWKPKFIVLHNTGAPTLTQWHGKTPAEQRIKNLVGYYRDQQGWSSGPHLFIADDFIWVFTPLTTPGTHTPSWNSRSIGIETVGDFDIEPFGAKQRFLVVGALACLHNKLGLDPADYHLGLSGLHFHKEDPRTTHKHCPGKNIVKSALLGAVQTEMRKQKQLKQENVPQAEDRMGGEQPEIENASDDDVSDEQPKSMAVSKIGLSQAAIGVGGASEVIGQVSDASYQANSVKDAADNFGITHTLGILATKPLFWISLMIILAACGAWYWRWRDHGRGKK